MPDLRMPYRLRGCSGSNWTCSDISWSPARRGEVLTARQHSPPTQTSHLHLWTTALSSTAIPGPCFQLEWLNAKRRSKHTPPPTASLLPPLQPQRNLQKSPFMYKEKHNMTMKPLHGEPVDGTLLLKSLGAFNSRQREEITCLLPCLCLSETHMRVRSLCFAASSLVTLKLLPLKTNTLTEGTSL